MREKQVRLGNIMLRAATVLLGMVLVSLYLVCGLYAKYTSSATGSDTARVAKFDILAEGKVGEEMIGADLAPGEELNIQLKVQIKSEVAVEYTISVNNVTKNLPLTFKMGGTVYEGGGEFTERLEANGADLMIYNLTVSWPEEHNSSEYAGLVDMIKVSVSASQID